MATVLLFSVDLQAVTKVAPAAAQCGATFTSAGNCQAILERLATGDVRVVVLDLNAVSADLSELITTIHATTPRPAVIAFGPHVHVEKLRLAAEAGCAAVC